MKHLLRRTSLLALLFLPLFARAQVTPDRLPIPTIQATDHVTGSPTASITVIEYADLECPFCAIQQKTMQSLLQEYPKDVRLVFRHFPLSFHADAIPAMRTSECVASLKGNAAFWKYVDAVFENGVENGNYLKEAQSLGVNDATLKTCMNGPVQLRVSRLLARQERRLQDVISGTPTSFVINKTNRFQMITGAEPLSSFEDAVASLLKTP